MSKKFSYYSSQFTYDSNAQAFITAASITDITQKHAINTLVLGLKSASLWSKIIALYPFVGGNATAHSYNLKNVAQYQLTFMGGWTHSSTGGLPSPLSGYAKTGLIPNGLITFNSNHLAFYNRTVGQVYNFYNIGAADNTVMTVNELSLVVKYNDNQAYYSTDAGYNCTFLQTANGKGLTMGTMNGTTTQDLYYNNVLKASAVSGGNLLASVELYIGGANGNGTATLLTDMECAFASIGSGFNSTQQGQYYTLIQAFQTSLSRQV